MLDWLKTILGDAYTEDIDKKVSAEVAKGFVPKTDFNAKVEAHKALETQLAEANKAIDDFKAKAPDVEAIQKAADDWKKKAEAAKNDADARIAEMELNATIESSITASKGKNAKAIRALLDMDAIRTSKNQSDDITKAIGAIKEKDGYLFEDETGTPPPYAAGTGTQAPAGKYPADIAAIRTAAGLKND